MSDEWVDAVVKRVTAMIYSSGPLPDDWAGDVGHLVSLVRCYRQALWDISVSDPFDGASHMIATAKQALEEPNE